MEKAWNNTVLKFTHFVTYDQDFCLYTQENYLPPYFRNTGP